MRWLALAGLVGCAAGNEDPNAERPDFGPPPDDGLCDVVGLAEGNCAPDFELLNQDGTPIRLHDKVGERLVVVGASMW